MWGAVQYHVALTQILEISEMLCDGYETSIKASFKDTAKIAFTYGFNMAMQWKGSDQYIKAELGVREMSTLRTEEIAAIYSKVADAAWLTIESKFNF